MNAVSFKFFGHAKRLLFGTFGWLSLDYAEYGIRWLVVFSFLGFDFNDLVQQEPTLFCD
jgi:hypothetical protein